jgi:hypothetical protein
MNAESGYGGTRTAALGEHLMHKLETISKGVWGPGSTRHAPAPGLAEYPRESRDSTPRRMSRRMEEVVLAAQGRYHPNVDFRA